MPKPNMYQSLHSTVIGPFGKPFEIQIRTYDMHRTAEYGIAAHWKYKETNNADGDSSLDSKLSWLREMLEWQGETSDAEEFMEGFKIDLFSDEVFVFTPKGDVISLPSDSTPIDFAYAIHTDVGHRCTGAKINGKIVTLEYCLKTGEIVEVLTSPNTKGPSIDWLNIAKSNQAKSKIKAWFKKANREESIEKGKEVVEKEAKKQGYSFGVISKSATLEKVLKRYNLKNLEDLFATVGVGDVNPFNLVTKLREAYEAKEKEVESNSSVIEQFNKEQPRKTTSYNNYSGLQVKGTSNVHSRFAKCCSPVPGDEIIGYITKGKGVSVHRSDCKNLLSLQETEPDKIIEVSWGNETGENYITDIQIRGEDRLGLLTDIIEILGLTKTNILSINGKTLKSGEALVNIKIKIINVEHLKQVQSKIRRLKGVRDVYRIKH